MLQRKHNPIPDYIKKSLDKNKFWEAYNARPAYQRNDYIGWITRAKREETRMKRLEQMLRELESGDKYMKMDYSGN